MDAWILDESPGTYRFGSIDTPEPANDEVRVRMVASALNHMVNDLAALMGWFDSSTRVPEPSIR